MDEYLGGYVGADAAAKMAGVTVPRLVYAEKLGNLPKPAQWHNRKVYTMADVQRIKDYFEMRKPYTRCSLVEITTMGDTHQIFIDGKGNKIVGEKVNE